MPCANEEEGLEVMTMKSICYTIVVLSICVAGNDVGAKPVTPDYSRLKVMVPTQPNISSFEPVMPAPPVRSLEPVMPAPPVRSLEPVMPTPPMEPVKPTPPLQCPKPVMSTPPSKGGTDDGICRRICQPDVQVGDKVSKGGCVNVEIKYDSLRGVPKNSQELFSPPDDGRFVPKDANAVTINKTRRGTALESAVLTHEVQHLLNFKNKFCEKYGYDYNSDECGLIDELSAFMSEGWPYEKAFNHIRDKYPEYREVIDKIGKTNTELGSTGICLAPTPDTAQSSFSTNSPDTAQSPSPTNSLDTAELEDLLKAQLIFLESLLAKGERATDGEIEVYNARQKKLVNVTMGIARKINALSVPDEEKQRIAEEKLAKATELAVQLQKSVDQVVKKKLIGGLKPLALTDLNGAAPAQATEDNGGCKCKNPSPQYTKVSDSIPAAAKCTRCGKTVGVLHHGKIIRTSRP